MKQKLPLFIIFSKKGEVFYKPIESPIDPFDLLNIKKRFNIEPDCARVLYRLHKTMPQQGGTLEYWLRIDDSTMTDGFDISGIEDRRDR